MKMREEFVVENNNIVTNVPENNYTVWLALVLTVAAVSLFGAGIVLFSDDSLIDPNFWVGLLIFSFFAALAIACAVGRKGSFEADEKSVTLRCGKIIMCIEYRDITGMNWGIRSCADRYGGVYYEERLVIAAVNGTYFVDAIIDIDYRKVTEEPSCLQQQIYNAKLSRLKKYITYNMSRGISGRLNDIIPSLNVG